MLPQVADRRLGPAETGQQRPHGLLGRGVLAGHEHVMVARQRGGPDHEVAVHRVERLDHPGARERALDLLGQAVAPTGSSVGGAPFAAIGLATSTSTLPLRLSAPAARSAASDAVPEGGVDDDLAAWRGVGERAGCPARSPGWRRPGQRLLVGRACATPSRRGDPSRPAGSRERLTTIPVPRTRPAWRPSSAAGLVGPIVPATSQVASRIRGDSHLQGKYSGRAAAELCVPSSRTATTGGGGRGYRGGHRPTVAPVAATGADEVAGDDGAGSQASVTTMSPLSVPGPRLARAWGAAAEARDATATGVVGAVHRAVRILQPLMPPSTDTKVAAPGPA